MRCFWAWIHFAWWYYCVFECEIFNHVTRCIDTLNLAKKRVFRPAINESRFSDSCGYDNLTTIKLLLYLPFVNWWKTLIETLKLCDFNFKAYQMGRNIFTVCNVYFKQGGKESWFESEVLKIILLQSTKIRTFHYHFHLCWSYLWELRIFLSQTLAFIVSINTTHGKDFHLVQYDFLWYLPLLSF